MTNTNDTGSGSLRQAILDCNANPGHNRIEFNIAGPGIHTIRPLSQLPAITNPDGVELDATTQMDYSGTPLIELDGSLAGAAVGLDITGSHCTVKGFIINRFQGSGIFLEVNGNNVIQGNYIGTDLTGRVARQNGIAGIEIRNGSHDNLIGTDGDGVNDTAERNLISGNRYYDVLIADTGSDRNVIAGNYLGTDVTGTRLLGNGDWGVWIQNGKANRIGVNSADPDYAAEGNLISGHQFAGVIIRFTGTDQNVVAGNFIGTDVTGTRALGNGLSGVYIDGGAQHNRIGTDGDGVADQSERNIISATRFSGDSVAGVRITGTGSDQNVVAGNFIGTDVTGTQDLGNHGTGIMIDGGAKANWIGTNGTDADSAGEGNIISASAGDGVSISGGGTNQNVVAGNIIGTDVNGTKALGNARGVAIFGGAQGNRVGTDGDGVGDDVERNLISGNRSDGVGIADPNTSQNVVAGNFIGTTIDGMSPLGNFGNGVYIVGGTQVNHIGVNTSDPDPAAEANLISGNRANGVILMNLGTNQNLVAGNLIGTDVTGTAALPNGGDGVVLANSAKYNRIGTAGDGVNPAVERNVISGNTFQGILITDSGTEQNVVAGNFIGTTSDGTTALGNSREGVLLQNGAIRNVIGFNPSDADPADDLNVISANGLGGVGIYGGGTDQNVVAGNLIGTDAAGTGSLGNYRSGVIVQNGPLNNTIGGMAIGTGNVIAHNADCGVVVDAANQTPILHNRIFDHPYGLGICLRNHGNNDQTAPFLASAQVNSGGTVVQGTLHSAPNTTFKLEFFASVVCDPPDCGEAEVFVDSENVTTDAGGNGSFTFTLPIIPVGQFLNATATDPLGNTSMFSACVVVTPGGTAQGGHQHAAYVSLSLAGASRSEFPVYPTEIESRRDQILPRLDEFFGALSRDQSAVWPRAAFRLATPVDTDEMIAGDSALKLPARVPVERLS